MAPPLRIRSSRLDDRSSDLRHETDIAMDVHAGTRDEQLPNARILALTAVFVVSGVCRLIFGFMWSHCLKRFFGHGTYAQTVVLVALIGGIALRAALVGHYA